MLGVVGLAVDLVTPFRVETGLLLNVRMAPVLALFALLALKPRKGGSLHALGEGPEARGPRRW